MENLGSPRIARVRKARDGEVDFDGCSLSVAVILTEPRLKFRVIEFLGIACCGSEEKRNN